MMIECPWCTREVVIIENVCPECKHEVLLDHQGNIIFEGDEETEEIEDREHTQDAIVEAIENRFKCFRCGHDHCEVNEVAMTGTGLSKLFDVQYNHYLFVSCLSCSYVEVYNPDILFKEKRGTLGTVMDILFGG